MVKGTRRLSTHLCMMLVLLVQRAMWSAGQFEVGELHAPSLSPAELRPRGISLLSNAGGTAEGILHAMSSLDCAGTELALISKTKFAEFSDQARCPPVDVVLLD